MTALPDEGPTPGPALAPPEVSVIVPVYRNEATLIELLDRLERALESEDHELIFVVDGSPDGSLALLRRQVALRPRLVVIELARNFGQHAALCAGFAAVRGRVALILDADLQQRPEDLPRFLARWREGHDFVSGRRISRHDPFGRRIASFCLNVIARAMTERELSDWGCPLAAVDRSLIKEVPSQGEKRRFLKPLVAQLSQRHIELDVEGEPARDRSSYSFLALVGVALDFTVSFSDRPFQRLAGLGFVGFAFGLLLGATYLGLRIVGAISAVPAVQVMALTFALLGLQVLILGALGEFTHRIYRLVQRQPFFEVEVTHTQETERAAQAELP